MLLPLLILLVPLGFAVTHIASTGTADPGPMLLAAIYVVMMLAAHFVLVATGNRGDPLLLPLVATIGGIGIVMLNRLAPDLGETSAFGLNLDVAHDAAAVVRGRRAGHAGRRHRPARRPLPAPLQVHVGAGRHRAAGLHLPVRNRGERRAAVDLPGADRLPARASSSRSCWCVFIAGYLAEHRALLRDASAAARADPDPAAALPAADAGDLRDRHAGRGLRQGPGHRAPVLRHLPDHAVRGHRAAQLRADRPPPLPGRLVRGVAPVRARRPARGRLARSRSPIRAGRATRPSRRCTPSAVAACSARGWVSRCCPPPAAASSGWRPISSSPSSRRSWA